MRYEKRSLIILTIYVLLMLAVLLIAVAFIKKNDSFYGNEQTDTQMLTDAVTEIIYVPVYSETALTEESTKEESFFRLVKAYEGKIGVFSEDGSLLQVIEVYIKTLPEADKRLLEEGFVINSESELHSIIEDYTG